MRWAVLFTSFLLLSIIPLSTNVTASGLNISSGIIISGTFNDSTESTTLTITIPETSDSLFLDELRTTDVKLLRVSKTIINTTEGEFFYDLIENFTLCNRTMLNSECAGHTFNIELHPEFPGNESSGYMLASQLPPAFVRPFQITSEGYINAHSDNNWVSWHNSFLIAVTPIQLDNTNVVPYTWIDERISEIIAVENLSASYSDGITDLTWDYPESIAMNHSIMIYSHDSPATRANWDSLTKTIVSSSVAAGTTNFEINHSSSPVEREVYYSVTLLYETSEDTRFLGSNTLTVPVKEDNIAPLFVGELSATFNSELDMTTIDWGAGISDDDLMINIYRSQMHLPMLDTNNLVATVDSSLSSYELEVPIGEHRQSWYAITLVDSQGNENLNLSESSPVADPVIESTISSSQISNLEAERYSDGTITINWDDTTQSPNAIAKIWRSVSGPISSFDDLEELASTDVSLEQYSHNPLNPVDQAWYAITIEGTWGSGSMPWHDDSLTSGVNSMENSFRETEDEIEEPTFDVLAQVQSTSGAGGEISDGDMISLGPMYEGDLIIISTSRVVENISCHDIAGQGSVIYSQTDWSLSFSANQSGEACYGTISDGDDEIGFTMTWNYIENITIVDDEGDEEDTEQDDEPAANKGSKESKDTIAGVILSIIILALLVYLLVMMKGPKYFEEE